MKTKNKIFVVLVMAVVLLQVAGPVAAYTWSYDLRPFDYAIYQESPSGDAEASANTDGTCTIEMEAWGTGSAGVGVLSRWFPHTGGELISMAVTFRAYLDAWIDQPGWSSGASLSIYIAIVKDGSYELITQKLVTQSIVYFGMGGEVDEYFSTGEYTKTFAISTTSNYRILVYMKAGGTSAEIQRDQGSSLPAYFFVYSICHDFL